MNPSAALASLCFTLAAFLSLGGCSERAVREGSPASVRSEPRMEAQPMATEKTQTGAVAPAAAKTETALFGAGCFWGVEHIFRQQPGVIDAVSGFAGGKTKNPTYKQVCYEETGHAEVVQVTFDPSKITYEQLVDIFFRLHDPTQVDGQGPDIGDQYRSVIFAKTPEQARVAQAVKERRAGKHSRPIATTIEPDAVFYKAEDYHQRYYEKTGKQPYCHFLRPE
jgi:methionine-S-sulfoxide reductase